MVRGAADALPSPLSPSSGSGVRKGVGAHGVRQTAEAAVVDDWKAARRWGFRGEEAVDEATAAAAIVRVRRGVALAMVGLGATRERVDDVDGALPVRQLDDRAAVAGGDAGGEGRSRNERLVDAVGVEVQDAQRGRCLA